MIDSDLTTATSPVICTLLAGETQDLPWGIAQALKANFAFPGMDRLGFLILSSNPHDPLAVISVDERGNLPLHILSASRRRRHVT
jgi:hypothetical protein